MLLIIHQVEIPIHQQIRQQTQQFHQLHMVIMIVN